MNLAHIIASILLLAASPSLLFASQQDRYAQIVLPFPDPRHYEFSHDSGSNAIVIEISGTSPSELEEFDNYDERLLRRVLMKDQGQMGTELRLILRDANVRATITHFNEPFRIVIDLFDRSYREQRDSESGLPLARAATSDDVPKDGMQPYQPQIGPSPTAAGTSVLVAPEQSSSSELRTKSGLGRRRLLQPEALELKRPEDMISALDKIPEGLGSAWKDYPVYIYRIQTAAYKTGKSYKSWVSQNTLKAMNSSDTLADYAGNLFDFGHEGRALIVYQHLIHKSPMVFDRNALALWRLAEIHLGQGNLTLAEGYYQSFVEKHQEDPLVAFAILRLQDIKAVRLIRAGQFSSLSSLTPPLDAVKYGTNAELSAQIAIRKAYWSPRNTSDVEAIAKNPLFLPAMESVNRLNLENAYPNVEGQRTAFLAASLILNDMVDNGAQWQKTTAVFAGDYLERYKGGKTEPFRASLIKKLQDQLNKTIQETEVKGRHTDTIKIYEELPSSLRVVRENAKTAWAIAEAYRLLAQPKNAMAFYSLSAQGPTEGPDHFRAEFWALMMGADALDIANTQGANTREAQDLKRSIAAGDKAVAQSWQGLKLEEKQKIFAAMVPNFEAAVTHNVKIKSPPLLVLEAWTSVLATATTASGGSATDWQRNYSPSANTVRLLTDLAKRFGELGMKKERASAINLLRSIKPAQFAGDKAAQKLWAEQLLGLAGEFRLENQFLEAGRIYALTGTEAQDWDGRAEALYKGGLLLFRAGRREEAIDALKKASQDGNNLLYAELAQKRLNQLQQ